MATLQDIATRAGVSRTTVSLALNGKGSISTAVRERIFRIAREIGYSSLQESRTSSRGLLAILIHEDYEKAFEWNFIRNIIIQLEATIMESGYHPVLVPVSRDIHPGIVTARLTGFSPRGVFSIHYANRELFDYFESIALPLVLINNSGFQDRFTTVCTDDYQGSYEGVNTLLSLGHRRIAFIDYNRPDLPEMVTDSYFGYSKALQAHGIDPGRELHATVDLTRMDQITEKLEELLRRQQMTSIFALDDYLAVRVWTALRDLHVSIPEKLSIIAPGDTLDYDEPYIPALTTMRVDTARMGRLAGSLMLEQLDAPPAHPTVVKIKQTLVDRGSVSRPGSADT